MSVNWKKCVCVWQACAMLMHSMAARNEISSFIKIPIVNHFNHHRTSCHSKNFSHLFDRHFDVSLETGTRTRETRVKCPLPLISIIGMGNKVLEKALGLLWWCCGSDPGSVSR